MGSLFQREQVSLSFLWREESEMSAADRCGHSGERERKPAGGGRREEAAPLLRSSFHRWSEIVCSVK